MPAANLDQINQDTSVVRHFARAVTSVCTDLIDAPMHLPSQQRVIELLMNEAGNAAEAFARLQPPRGSSDRLQHG